MFQLPGVYSLVVNVSSFWYERIGIKRLSSEDDNHVCKSQLTYLSTYYDFSITKLRVEAHAWNSGTRGGQGKQRVYKFKDRLGYMVSLSTAWDI